MWHPKVKTVFIAVLLLGSALILYLGLRAEQVAAIRVAKQDYVPSLLLSGEVIAETQVNLSSLITGTVVQRPVQTGAEVKAGQLIVQLDDRQAMIARDAAVGAVETARANLRLASTLSLESARSASVEADLAAEKAQLQFERMKSLYQNGAISQQELETAAQNQASTAENARAARLTLESYQNGGVNLEILQSQLDQRQRDLEAKELVVEQHRIKAPADGKVLEIYVREGEMIVAGGSIARFSSGQQIRIRIQPDQRYSNLASLNNRALIWIPYEAGSKWEARVVHTDPAGNAEQGSLEAELALEQDTGELYPGRLVSVQLFGAVQPDTIIIANSFLAVEAGQEGVWIASGARARFVPVQTGLRTAEGVVITAGLAEGDVVLDPQGRREGQRVAAQIKGSD